MPAYICVAPGKENLQRFYIGDEEMVWPCTLEHDPDKGRNAMRLEPTSVTGILFSSIEKWVVKMGPGMLQTPKGKVIPPDEETFNLHDYFHEDFIQQVLEAKELTRQKERPNS